MKLKITLLVVAVLLGASQTSVAQDSNSAERFFGYLDRNKDGRIDSDEVKRMPGSVREAFRDLDISIDRGISKESFVREMPRIMESMRRRRDEERDSRKREEEKEKKSQESREQTSKGEQTKSSQPDVYTPRKAARVTMDIPAKFEEGDDDGDGQIGVYEWRKWKPEERFHFPVYDLNQDGFLTPRELSNPPSKEEIDQYLASLGVAVPNSKIASTDNDAMDSAPTANVSTTPEKTDGKRKKPKGPKQIDPQNPLAKTAAVFFKQMDADKNGSLSPDEWARSRRLKPKFEQAGVDLSQNMNLDQFTVSYVRVYQEDQDD